MSDEKNNSSNNNSKNAQSSTDNTKQTDQKNSSLNAPSEQARMPSSKATKNTKPDNKTTKVKANASQLSNNDKTVEEKKPKMSNEKPSEQPPTPIKDQQTEQPLFSDKAMPKLEVPTNNRTNEKGRLGIWLVLLLTLSGVIALAWFTYQQWQIQRQTAEQQTTLNQQLSSQSRLLAQLQNAVESSAKQNQTNLANDQKFAQMIEQLQESLTVTQQRLKELSGRRQQDWMLAEAEYLIKIADYKISLDSDHRSAILLLKAADEKIQEMGDNSLLELRQSISDDIANLELTYVPDIGGITLALNTIAEQIPSLEIVALEFDKVAIKDIQSTNNDESFSLELLYQNFLKDFVTVKDHSEPVKPLMTIEQRGLLNANIQLAIQQAQIAALNGESQIYQMHLGNAINWINIYFKQSSSATAIQSRLTELKQAQIEVELPRKLESRQIIESINQQRLYQWLDGQAATSPSAPGEVQSL